MFRRWCEAGDDVLLVSAAPHGEAETLGRLGFDPLTIPVSHRLDLRAAMCFQKLLRADPPDIVYAPRNTTLSCALLAAHRIPGVRVVGYRGTMGHISRFDPASWLTYLNSRLDLIVCVSDAVRHYLSEFRLPEQRMTRIYKGHDLNWYQPSARAALAEFGIPDGVPVVGFTGNMRPVKGVEHLVDALPLLDRGLNVHLLLVGELRDNRLRRLCARSPVRDRIHLAGFRRDAAALMGACDLFVMPSVEREGLPRAVIEAMAQGVAPVVTNVGGMPELVEEGVSGLVVPSRNPAAIATALTTLLEDSARRHKLGAAAKRRIEEKFNIEATCREYRKAFERLLASQSVR